MGFIPDTSKGAICSVGMDSDDDVNWRLLSTPSPPSIRAESTKAISRDSGTLPVLTPTQTLANLDDVPLLFYLENQKKFCVYVGKAL